LNSIKNKKNKTRSKEKEGKTLMKKTIITGLVVFALLATIGMANAAPTTVDIDWNSAGYVDIDVVSDDDFHSQLHTFSGSQAIGSYLLTDSENNPYGYGVDTVTAQVEANVAGGGYLVYNNTRTDSHVSMYGAAGERSYTEIVTDDTAQLQFRTGSNYAKLLSSNYGFHANDHFQATGTFSVFHSLFDDTGEGAYISSIGTGSTDIDFMSESTWGKTGSFMFGKGCGCYTNADITAAGAGIFEVGAIAENQITVDLPSITINGDGTLGSAQYLLQATYGDGFSFSNFALSGN